MWQHYLKEGNQKFQFHKVQLKDGEPLDDMFFNDMISIPQGPIKSSAVHPSSFTSKIFQFHKVQLKAIIALQAQDNKEDFNSTRSN